MPPIYGERRPCTIEWATIALLSILRWVALIDATWRATAGGFGALRTQAMGMFLPNCDGSNYGSRTERRATLRGSSLTGAASNDPINADIKWLSLDPPGNPSYPFRFVEGAKRGGH